MLISVPQYIDVEDKVAGPLTVKQLGWMLALGIILLIMWNTLSGPSFFILGLPVVLIFLALTFYKPYGQPLGSFVVFAVMFYFRPKIYTWKRSPERERVAPKAVKVSNVHATNSELTSETLHGLAQLLDSEGTTHSEDIDEILKRHHTKK